MRAPSVRPRPARARGQTLLELTVVVVVLAILAVAAVPSYRRTEEQARVDACGAALATIWGAQRAHWLEARSYAPDLVTLRDEGLLDEAAYSGWSSFEFEVTTADETTFTATATRNGTVWSGTLAVSESGAVTGHTTNPAGDDVAPGSR